MFGTGMFQNQHRHMDSLDHNSYNYPSVGWKLMYAQTTAPSDLNIFFPLKKVCWTATTKKPYVQGMYPEQTAEPGIWASTLQ